MTDLYPETKLFGPYTSKKDGRKRIVLQYPDGKLKTVSYPKYLMECHLGRYLTKNETVDHIDRDFTNDNFDNLQILDRKNHVNVDRKWRKSQDFICSVCETKFTLSGQKMNDATRNRKRGNSGPYCGRVCAGKDSSNQNRITHEVTTDYFLIDKQKI